MFKTDDIQRGVLLVYKTRNRGWFNFSQSTYDIEDMPIEAKKEYVELLRTLAKHIEISYK